MREEILEIINKAFKFRNDEEYDWEQLKDVYEIALLDIKNVLGAPVKEYTNIEERASGVGDPDVRDGNYDYYVLGAKEQLENDIRRIQKWILEKCDEYQVYVPGCGTIMANADMSNDARIVLEGEPLIYHTKIEEK